MANMEMKYADVRVAGECARGFTSYIRTVGKAFGALEVTRLKFIFPSYFFNFPSHFLHISLFFFRISFIKNKKKDIQENHLAI